MKKKELLNRLQFGYHLSRIGLFGLRKISRNSQKPEGVLALYTSSFPSWSASGHGMPHSKMGLKHGAQRNMFALRCPGPKHMPGNKPSQSSCHYPWPFRVSVEEETLHENRQIHNATLMESGRGVC